MRHIRLSSRCWAVPAVFALLLALPIGALAHGHSDRAVPQCQICKVPGAEPAVLHDGPALPAPQNAAGPQTDGVELLPGPPAAAAGTPRAPPS